MKRGKYRKAVFIVVYSQANGKIRYLLLKRKLHWIGWEFPKGGMKFLETQKMAVKREIKEETGLRILKIKKFKIFGKYKYAKKYSDRKGINGQTYSLYAVEVRKGKVRIDKMEHSAFKWVDFNEALKKLTWENQKRCLKIVNEKID